MANRTWLAVALCCLVWFGYMRWFAPPPPVPVETATKTEVPGTAAPKTAAPTDSKTSTTTAAAPAKGGNPFSHAPTLVEAEAARLSTPAREVFVSDSGGKIATIRLLEYHVALIKESPNIESLDAANMPLSLTTLFTSDRLQGLGYEKYSRSAANGNVVMKKANNGFNITKTYQNIDGDYFLQQEIKLEFPSAGDFGYLYVPVGGTGLTAQPEAPLHAWEAVAFQGDKVTRKAYADIKPGSEVLQGLSKWIAFGNRYFSTAVVNESSLNPDIVFEKNDHLRARIFDFL